MPISARNLFRGQVTALREGPVNAEVELTTATGDRIVATVTDASVKSLGVVHATSVARFATSRCTLCDITRVDLAAVPDVGHAAARLGRGG